MRILFTKIGLVDAGVTALAEETRRVSGRGLAARWRALRARLRG